MMTHLSNHINNPSIRFRVPKNLGIEPDITSLAQILTGHFNYIGQRWQPYWICKNTTARNVAHPTEIMTRGHN